jgi:N-acetyl-gamma-glutamyl-phosphate reductase
VSEILSPAVANRPGPASPARTARIVVLGASGYAGAELARLALAHPGVERLWLVTRDPARDAAALLPGLVSGTAALPPVVGLDEAAALVASGEADTLVSALPHGAWRELAAERPALVERPARIIDLSSDHRAATRDGSAGWVYGLPEAFRSDVARATRVANPGCYATAAALALLPAAEAGALSGTAVIAALSGASGAGRAAELGTSFVELDGGARYYKVGTVHAHVAEIERTLARVAEAAGRAAAPIALGFAPQIVPMARGILLTATAPLAEALEPAEARALYQARYAEEPFVRLLEEGAWPETRAVRASNRCDLQVTTLFAGTTLLVTAALDNLGKGAAGQALQNLNLMLGRPETDGLPLHGSPW